MPVFSTSKTVWVGIAILLVVIIAVYAIFDPAGNPWFPKCPFRMLTGLDCPGCGSQRAVHALLGLDIVGALRANALMVMAIPYVIGGFAFESVKNPSENAQKWRKRLYGTTAIWIVFTVVVLYWIIRNII